MNGRPSGWLPLICIVHTAPGPLGHRRLGPDLGERLEQRVGQEHADHVAGRARLRRHRVDDAALRRLDLDRGQAAVVVRQVGIEHRAHGERRVGVGVVLHHVDAVRAGVARAGVVDEDLALLGIDGDGAHDVDAAPVGEVELGRGVVRAGGQLGDRRPGGGLAALDDLVGERLDVVEAVARAEAQQPLGADLAAGHLGVQIAGHVVGLADVGQDEPPHVVVALARPHQLADRDPQAFLEHVAGAGADAVAADVGVVDRAAEERDRPDRRGTPGTAR